jgi:DNA-binding FrmR family transcriptional regulator
MGMRKIISIAFLAMLALLLASAASFYAQGGEKEKTLFFSLDRRGLVFYSIYHRGVWYMENRPKQDTLMRLRRIEGQIRGLQKMVEGGAACEEVLTQVAAATAAIKKAGLVMIQGYMDECLEKAGKEAGSKQKEPLKDFHRAISRYMNWN